MLASFVVDNDTTKSDHTVDRHLAIYGHEARDLKICCETASYYSCLLWYTTVTNPRRNLPHFSGCYCPAEISWYLQVPPFWAQFIIVPTFSVISLMAPTAVERVGECTQSFGHGGYLLPHS